MSAVEDSRNLFYHDLQNSKEQIGLLWPDIDRLENTQFYELCQKYSDIALNAPKRIIPGTCDIQASFQCADIDAAKRATKDYVIVWKIYDVDALMDLIHKFHPRSVTWDDTRTTSGLVQPKNFSYQSIYGGQYYNFKAIPDDMWERIAHEVKEYVLN